MLKRVFYNSCWEPKKPFWLVIWVHQPLIFQIIQHLPIREWYRLIPCRKYAKWNSYFLYRKRNEQKKCINRWQLWWECPEKSAVYIIWSPAEDWGWLKGKHRDINYNFSQLSTGRGKYHQYVYRFRLDSSPDCPNGDELTRVSGYVLNLPKLQTVESRGDHGSTITSTAYRRKEALLESAHLTL